jgi:hypothetical protein
MVNKKIVFVLAFVAFLLSAGASYSYFSSANSGPSINLGYKKPVTDHGNGTTDSGEPKTEECPINGAMYGKSQKAKWDTRRPLFVMVQNNKEARPQSGLSMADVIYEIVAEGGITRFGTVYYCNDPKIVGSVRSARVHFLKFAQEYGENPLYAHVGGANTPGPADALGLLSKLGWKGYNDLDQFRVPFPSFWRDYERLPGRATEHTVYTNTQKLWDFAKTKHKLTNVDEDGVAWDKTFTKWKFQDDAKAGDRGTTNKVSFGFWSNNLSSDYTVEWNYDKTTNSYKRVNGGEPHIDMNTKKQLEAKNVIVVFSEESPANDGYTGGQHLLYDLEGTGDAIVFQNGKAIKATWNKKNPKTRMTWTDEDGKEIAIVRGQTWVEVLPADNKVTY